MAIAQTLINYLQERNIDYDLVEHPHTETARDSAKSSNLPAHQIAKSVLLKDEAGYADCEPGAVPALGEAYGIQVIWDDDLQYTADVYIEAGDHEHLIRLERRDFRNLMKSLPHTVISKDEEVGGWKR
jgi:Ala-tRNA(Pro) deacylase